MLVASLFEFWVGIRRADFEHEILRAAIPAGGQPCRLCFGQRRKDGGWV